MTYKSLPYTCYLYPIDKKDLDPRIRSHCQFYWDEK